MLGTKLKVFEFEAGETDWVIAKTEKQAKKFLETCTDVDKDTIVTEVSLDRLKKLKYHSDEFTGSLFQQYLRLLLSEKEFPAHLAGSEY